MRWHRIKIRFEEFLPLSLPPWSFCPACIVIIVWGRGGSLTKAAMNTIIIMLPKLSPSKRRIHRVIDNDRWRRGGPEGNCFPYRISISLLLLLVLGQNTRGCRCWERPPTSIQLLPITSKFEQALVSQAKKAFSLKLKIEVEQKSREVESNLFLSISSGLPVDWFRV